MSQPEFLLLSRLGVSVPDASSQAPQMTRSSEGRFRVLAPCMRPPVKGAMAAQMTSPRHIPTAPLADYAGEVITVKGKDGRPDTEYLIYNAKSPSIWAANLKLMEEQRRKREEDAVSRMSPDKLFIDSHESDNLARRRVLEHLQRINREEAQRKVEERARERQRRLERELADLRAVEEAAAKEAADLLVKKQAERHFMQQAVLEATEHKRLESADVNGGLAAGCAAFPWDEVSQNGTSQREKCLLLLDANRKLAELKKKEQQTRKIEEKVREETVLAEVRAQAENEKRKAVEKKRRLAEERRSASVEAQVKTVPAVVELNDRSASWFLQSTREDAGARRERERELMETNKQLAKETKRRRAEDAERQLQEERKRLQESERAYKQEMERERAEKRKQQDAVNQAALKAAAERHAKRQESHRDELDLGIFKDDSSKVENERRRREQFYRDELKRDIEDARKARRGAKEREIMEEKRFLSLCETEARRTLEINRVRAAERRETYRKALEEQIRSKKTETTCEVPATHRGPVMKVLYRCPVTGELLRPDQFGISSARQRRSGWSW
ncbi:hypothetical protein TraAM80_07256 [Trypanosoma rangeli]|uniref:Uncharacterized protein n=1 Tax=Trypanosoma rangeli TaxID=5698 RepID=A0A422N6D2_TRYRA|nr:uncharacterized protein TraAM80_07256 [Trypanosoma rangeli]RNF01044.1 hypothetical protein TraAM80_07256 [Trypanosoma rangeli]|eukprot:RNF01044.1 hypothetical protein TraAM80_07256 [Trypanosoma rangeli]